MKLLPLILLLLVWGSAPALAQKGQFFTADEFHSQVFPGQPTTWQTLWVDQARRQVMESILGHAVPSLRIRYWGQGDKTAWMFEEIGKELPITVGVVVKAGTIEQIQVLEFRESRGGEVRYPFFTDQFRGVGLTQEANSWTLDGHIDGITGATLSVRALTKIATLALYCHQQTPFAQGAEKD